MSPNDRELLQRFVQVRDELAFAALVERYIGLVYHSVLRRIGDAHAAEDITQLVFTTLAQKAVDVSRHETVVGWLHTTARWETHHYLRRERRRVAREEAAAMIDETNTEAAKDWERLRPAIDGALDRLDGPDRDAVLLRFFSNATFAAIGEQLGVSENAARMRVDRALEKLHRLLRTREITSVSLATALAAEASAASAPAALATQVAAQALAAAPALVDSVLFTMSTMKAVTIATALVVAGAIGIATYEAEAARRDRLELAAKSRLIADADARAAMLRTQIDTLASADRATQARIGELQPKVDAGKTPPTASNPERRYGPDQVEVALALFRSALSRFRPFYAAAHLTPVQIAQFEAIQIECQQNVYDIWSTAEAAGLGNRGDTAAGTAIARMTSDPIKDRNDKLQELLGPDRFKQYQEFDSPRSSQTDLLISALAGEMYATPTPLTATQGAELRQLIVDSTKIEELPMAADGGRPVVRLNPKTDWDAVLSGAGAILSQDQLQALHDRVNLSTTPLRSNGDHGS